MSGIPLAKSEFKQIQTDLLTELTADLSVDHLDLDLGSSADDGTVQMTAVYMAFLVTGCDMEMKINDEKTPDNASETVEDAIRNKEGERLLKYIRDDAFVITLEIGGEQLTSENFARKIKELGIRGTSHIQFVIGGSIGLGKEVLKRSDYALSFSKMTFPHYYW